MCILSHPAIKGGLSHCGMEETLEFINSNIPIIAWPHFFDQHDNAENLAQAGATKILFSKTRITKYPGDGLSYDRTSFDEVKVYNLFVEIVTIPKYKQNM